MLVKSSVFPADDIHIEQLTEFNADYIKDFNCNIKDLNDFLKDDALLQQKEGLNVTYLWLSKSSKKLLCYITLCADAIRLEGKKKEEMKSIGIKYKSLPALKIARMGVDKNFAGQKLGTRLIAFTVNLTIDLSSQIGCRFLTLEAKNTPDLPEEKKPIHFYKKFDFAILKERKPNADYIAMYKDLGPLIKGTRLSQSKNRLVFPNNIQ